MISTASRSSSWWITVTLVATLLSFTLATVLAPRAGAAPLRGLTWLLFVGSSVHVASTAWLFTWADVRAQVRQQPRRFLLAPASLVTTLSVAAALMSSSSFAWLLVAFFAWQFFHFMKQNLGISALCARSRGVEALRPTERNALWVAGVAGTFGLCGRPSLLQLPHQLGVAWVLPVSAVVFTVAVAIGAWSLWRRPSKDRPLALVVTYLTSLAFMTPVFVFTSPYAAVSGMVVAHGLQYLVLLSWLATGTGTSRERTVRLGTLANVALVGGLVLSSLSHLHSGSSVVRLLFGAYLGVVTSHFVVDAGLWRLRDPDARQFLSTHLPALMPTRAETLLGSSGVTSGADIR